jgi:hypothetical protein
MSDDRSRMDRNQEDERLAELLGTLREDVRASADLREAVMRRIEERRPSALARLTEWMFRPRLVPVSPALGALAVAALAAIVFVRPAPTAAPTSTPVADAPARVVTRFVLVAPGASSVHLTGDFASWRPDGVALEELRNGTGIWTGDVPLSPGVHQYTFVVNGTQWVPDPSAVLQVDDGFGQVNSIVVVPEAGEA